MEINVSAEVPEAATALALLDAARLPLIENEVFEGRIIFLDGRAWRNVLFKNCALVARLGWFHIENVEIQGGTFEPSGLVQGAHAIVALVASTSSFRPTIGEGH